MSKKKTSYSDPSVNITQIKEGSVISGTMQSSHSIRVDGMVTGDMISEEKIIVGQQADIEGNLFASDLTIQGRIKGQVTANGQLQVMATAKIDGDIFAKSIMIEGGAQLNGRLSVGQDVNLPIYQKTTETASNNQKAYGNIAG